MAFSALRVAELRLSKKHEELVKKLENWMLRQELLVIFDDVGALDWGLPSKMALLELKQLIGDWGGLVRYSGAELVGDETHGDITNEQ